MPRELPVTSATLPVKSKASFMQRLLCLASNAPSRLIPIWPFADNARYFAPVKPLLTLLLLGAVSSFAADGSPASSNVPGRDFPRIHPDRRVTFRIKAPEARKVQVAPRGSDNGLGQGPFEMVAESNGVWSATIPP